MLKENITDTYLVKGFKSRDSFAKYRKLVNSGKITDSEFLDKINAEKLDIKPAEIYKSSKGGTYYKLGDKMIADRRLVDELKNKSNWSKMLLGSTNSSRFDNEFSDANPTPEQEGVINFLKGFVEEHPGEAKYLVELGAKWGPDNLLEGLNHDAEGDKTESKKFSKFSPAVAKMFSSDSLVRQAARFLDSQGIEGSYGRHKSKLKEEFHLTDDEVNELVDALYDKYGDEDDYDPKFGGPTLDSMGRRTVHHDYSKKFSKFSPAVAKMFADKYDDSDEIKRNLRKSVKDAIGSLGLQVPEAKFENGYTTITMKIHHDKVDKVKKAISKLPSDIGVICKCSDPSKTDLTWYDLIFVQK